MTTVFFAILISLTAFGNWFEVKTTSAIGEITSSFSSPSTPDNGMCSP